jgi:hypothetical protein
VKRGYPDYGHGLNALMWLTLIRIVARHHRQRRADRHRLFQFPWCRRGQGYLPAPFPVVGAPARPWPSGSAMQPTRVRLVIAPRLCHPPLALPGGPVLQIVRHDAVASDPATRAGSPLPGPNFAVAMPDDPTPSSELEELAAMVRRLRGATFTTACQGPELGCDGAR